MRYSREVTVTVVLSLLIIGSFVLTEGSRTEGLGTRDGEGDNPYCTFYDYYLDSHYMGDVVSFRIRVYNTYDGRHWEDEDNYYYDHYLYNSKLSIKYDDVTDDLGFIKPIIQPTQSGSLTPYNGPSSEGFTISSSNNYYEDEYGNYFQMKIDTSNIKEGYYRIPLRLSFKVARSYNDQNPGEVFYLSKFQDGYVQFYVRSHVYGVEYAPLEIEGREGNGPAPLYAGAKYMTIQTKNTFRVQTNTLTEFKADIDFGNEGIRPTTSRISYEVFDYTYRNLKWRVDIIDTAPPGFYTGSLIFRYIQNDEQYIDGPYEIKLKVESTPLLHPSNMDTDLPVASILQKEKTCGISFNIRNIGNVDLATVTIRLDIDSSKFLKQGEFKYDEGGGGEKVYPPLEFTKFDVKTETSFNAFFPFIEVYEMMPPGEYMIPVDYSVTYVDPFDDSGISSKLYSYQWDEMGTEDYMEIMWYREDPRPVHLSRPYVILRVEDDAVGADISIQSHNILNSSKRGQSISFEIINRELYTLTGVSAILTTPEPDRILLSGADKGSGILLDKNNLVIPAATFERSGVLKIEVPVDVETFRTETFLNCTLLVNFMNITGNVQSNSFDIPVIIYPGEGSIDILTARVSDIVNERFTVYIDVINTGDTVIEHHSVLINSPDNMITFDQDMIIMGILSLGELRTIEFNCTLGEGVTPGSTYSLSIRASMVDVNGFSMDYFDRDPYYTYILIPENTGMLKVISTSTSEILPGEPFTVTVKVLNTGSARVTWSEILLLSKDNLITLDTPIFQMDPVEPGDTATASFQCLATPQLGHSEQCCMVVRTSYRDEYGNSADFFAQDGEELSIMSSPEPEDKEMEKTIRSTGLMVMIGILIAFAMISLAIIISILLFTRAYAKRGNQEKVKEAKVEDEINKALPKPQVGTGPFGLNLEAPPQKEQLKPYQPAPVQQEQVQQYQPPQQQAPQYQPAQYSSPPGSSTQDYSSNIDDLFGH